MCGIAGWVGATDESSLERMIAALKHRGPDEVGIWASPAASLGMSRLSIIDVQDGHQPVFSMDESVVAVGNGEIYNYRELASHLVGKGIRLRSNSDIEVIPHLYRLYGTAFVHRLRGMFAIALWDRGSNELVLARDRVGKKPIVYARHGEGLLFASEVRALLAVGWRSEPDLPAIDHLLAFGYLPVGSGAFTDLYSLPPGHIGIWDGQNMRLERYWQWEPSKKKLEMAGLGERVEAKLEEAVQLRLVSERPVGAWLSGGIDSTVITALMARAHSGPIRTFSIGFEDPRHDESVYARTIANVLGTQHQELIVEPDPVLLLTQLAEAFDQPLADSSAIPTILLSQMTANQVVVALSGDGGDETFGGYERYAATSILQKGNPIWRALSPFRQSGETAAKNIGLRRLERAAREMRPMDSLGTRYLSMMEYIPSAVRRYLWTKQALSLVDPDDPWDRMVAIWRERSDPDSVTHMRAMDMQTYLPGDLLTKVDISSMACSLEVRSPFLDQEVLSLAGQLPKRALVRGTTTKWLLREIAYRLVPRSAVDRPKKGFGIPRAAWMRGPLREMARDLLLDSTARQRGWFEPSVIENLLDEHDKGIDRDLYLWPLLVTELWARRWVDLP